MAIASICSSPSPCPPTLPTISLPSLLPTFPSSSKTHHSVQRILPTSFKIGGNLVSGDSLSIAEAAEAIALAGSAAMEATNNSVSVASGIGKVGHFGEGDNGGVRDGSVGIELRRKRRRKRRRNRRKGLGFLDEQELTETSQNRGFWLGL